LANRCCHCCWPQKPPRRLGPLRTPSYARKPAASEPFLRFRNLYSALSSLFEESLDVRRRLHEPLLSWGTHQQIILHGDAINSLA
jgi:hypothetical protein